MKKSNGHSIMVDATQYFHPRFLRAGTKRHATRNENTRVVARTVTGLDTVSKARVIER